MALLIILILVVAAATGALASVLKIAAGVAIGIFLGGVLLVVAAWLFLRRAVRRSWRPRQYR